MAKTVLVPSRLPGTDYVINPYTGCTFGCAYCYASYTGRFVGESVLDWGNYVYVKVNAVEVFKDQLSKLPSPRRQATILLSSVTDPYQGVERKYRLTRGILEVLVQEQYPGLVSILTKSPLVLRDVSLFRELRMVEVGMTVTTTDDTLGRLLEVRAPLSSVRLKTLKDLHDAGIATYAFVGPLLPHFAHKPSLLEGLFARLAEVGVQSIFVEHLNLKLYIRRRILSELAMQPADFLDAYRDASSGKYHQALEAMVSEFVEKYSLKLRLGRVIYHGGEECVE